MDETPSKARKRRRVASVGPAEETLEKAEARFRRETVAGNLDTYISLGILLKETGRAEDSESVYLEALRKGIDEALVPYADVVWELGRLEEAETLYRRTSELGNTYARTNLGLLLEETGRQSEGHRSVPESRS